MYEGVFNSDIPVDYKTKNIYNSGFSPSTVHCRDSRLFSYFRKYLLTKAMSVYKWIVPDNWDMDYLLYSIYCYGYVSVLSTDDFGVIPQFGALGGYNVYYRPTYVIVSNPMLPATKRTIGVDTEIIKMQPDFSPIIDLINYYADMMAMASQSISINLLNSHTATIFPASTKAEAETYKKMFDNVASGQPAVVVGKNLFDETGKPRWTPFEANLKNLYIGDQILSDLRKIEEKFDTEIGIPNANTDKRERLISSEVNANNVETIIRPTLWLEELKAGCDKVNNMFGIDVSVNWRYPPDEQEKSTVSTAFQQEV